MAKKGLKKNFNYKKLGNAMPKIISDNLNVWGNWINKEIQESLTRGEDVKGGKFPSLRESTKSLREGSTPLIRKGQMRKTKIRKSTPSTLTFQIEMVGKSQKAVPTMGTKRVKRKKHGQQYGVFHNEGYTTSAKSAIPGKKVPARKWWGIPKAALPGGKGWNKAALNRRLRIAKALKSFF